MDQGEGWDAVDRDGSGWIGMGWGRSGGVGEDWGGVRVDGSGLGWVNLLGSAKRQTPIQIGYVCVRESRFRYEAHTYTLYVYDSMYLGSATSFPVTERAMMRQLGGKWSVTGFLITLSSFWGPLPAQSDQDRVWAVA